MKVSHREKDQVVSQRRVIRNWQFALERTPLECANSPGSSIATGFRDMARRGQPLGA